MTGSSTPLRWDRTRALQRRRRRIPVGVRKSLGGAPSSTLPPPCGKRFSPMSDQMNVQDIRDGHKLCACCGLFLELSACRANPMLRSGLSSWCRACQVERTRRWRARTQKRSLSRRRAPYRPLPARSCDRCAEAFTPRHKAAGSARAPAWNAGSVGRPRLGRRRILRPWPPIRLGEGQAGAEARSGAPASPRAPGVPGSKSQPDCEKPHSRRQGSCGVDLGAEKIALRKSRP
jgi:hypothetical protein